MINSGLNAIKLRLRDFAEARDWRQFHSPKNLSMALSVAVSETVEHFKWLTEDQSKTLPKDKLTEVELMSKSTLLIKQRVMPKNIRNSMDEVEENKTRPANIILLKNKTNKP